MYLLHADHEEDERMTPHLIPYQVGQAGEHLVAAEVCPRMADFTPPCSWAIGQPLTYLPPSPDQQRTVSIQVKTKTSGTLADNDPEGQAE